MENTRTYLTYSCVLFHLYIRFISLSAVGGREIVQFMSKHDAFSLAGDPSCSRSLSGSARTPDTYGTPSSALARRGNYLNYDFTYYYIVLRWMRAASFNSKAFKLWIWTWVNNIIKLNSMRVKKSLLRVIEKQVSCKNFIFISFKISRSFERIVKLFFILQISWLHYALLCKLYSCCFVKIHILIKMFWNSVISLTYWRDIIFTHLTVLCTVVSLRSWQTKVANQGWKM